MSIIPDGPAKCGQCGRLASPIIYQGETLEPICMDCLEQADPARAAVLKRIGKLPGSPSPSP